MKRWKNENFESYKKRRKNFKILMKRKLKGTLRHDSQKNGTYRKPEENINGK